jgi:hypothetical protein
MVLDSSSGSRQGALLHLLYTQVEFYEIYKSKNNYMYYSKK